MFLVEMFLVLILVDFASGLIHWVEDTFGNETTPIIGNWIIKPNVLHHRDAHAFVKNSWLKSSWDLLIVGILILLAAYFLGYLTWHIGLFIIIGVNANQIHKYNHMPATKLPKLVTILQKLFILQSSSHHATHHYGEKNTHYCVITPILNPFLDSIGFWRAMECLFVPIFGKSNRLTSGI